MGAEGLPPFDAHVSRIHHSIQLLTVMKHLPSLLSLAGALCLLAPTSLAQGGDDCANATPIAGLGLFQFDNTNATASGIADCNGAPTRKDVWFAWTSPMTGEIRYQTCGTNTPFDTRISVYSDTNCGSLAFLACATQSCMGLSQLTFSAVQGQTYLLRLGSRMVGVGGAGEFRMRDEPCPASLDDNLEDNDLCDEATPLADGSYPGLWVSKADPDWYSICVPGGATVTMDILFTDATGDLDVYAFDACAGGTSIGQSTTGTDDEQIVYTNPSASAQQIFVRCELWIDDPTQDCNDYSITVTGGNGLCGGAPIGTNYCTPVANSTGVPAVMSAVGSDVTSDNSVQLIGSDMPAFAFAFFIVSEVQGFAMGPGGSDGNLCLGGAIGRYVGPGQIQQAGLGGSVALTIDLTQVPQPLGFVSIAPGETWNFQAWYRDSTPSGPTSNFTDGLSIAFQ